MKSEVRISSNESMLDDSYDRRSLIKQCTLSFAETQHSLEILIDTDATEFAFIDRRIAQLICDILRMSLVSLSKSKSLRDFDDKQVTLITHVIYSILIIDDHFEIIVFMLITNIDSHSLILDKL